MPPIFYLTLILICGMVIKNWPKSYVFEQPGKITKTRIYKPLSALTGGTTYTVEFIKGE